MYRSTTAVLLLGALATTLAQPADEARPPYCGPNEHFEASSYSCQITCDNMHLEPVMGACASTNTCFCNGGYVRNKQGTCIKRENCPAKTCPSNEHYEKNTVKCQITCANMHLEPIMGPCYPNSACFCNTGFVRNDKGVCIKRENCPPRCPPFEHYLNQTVQCQITCKTLPLEPYMGPCWPTSGCFCLPGYVRNDAGICIKREECPIVCPSNEHYEKNTVKCQITCANMHLEPIMGPCYPNSACYCDAGFVRNDKGVCIKRENCPPRCPPFERYLNQTVQCQITCKTMPLEPYMGPCWPTSGCFCLPGYVRNDAGICIKREECPKPMPVCGPNEVSTDCYNDCQTTCKNRFVSDGKVCTLACTRTGCICQSGFYRHDNGTCVPSQECSPATCNKGETYTTCGSSCPTTCQTRGDTCKVCTLQCVEGCFCSGTTIRAPDGTCVEPRNCPPRTCSGQNEVFDKCPPTCPRTENCSNIWSRIPCTPIDCCTPSCRCKPGFFRNDQNVCISSRQCQNYQSQSKAEAESTNAEATAEATANAAE